MRKADEKRRERARQMRYKKPIVRNLSLDTIKEELWEIQGECEEVRWCSDSDDDTLINALDGDENEAYEFRVMFADLCAECESMMYDLDEEWVPACFDQFFVAVGAGDEYGGLLGWDSYEQDYFGIYGMDAWAEDATKKTLKQLKKDELIAAARQCFRVYHSYMALRYRYDCLKASLDILRAQNIGYIQLVKRFEEVYEKADKESHGFKYQYGKEVLELDRILEDMPQEAWIQ